MFHFLMAVANILPRDDDSCTGGNFTSANGLQFTKSCDTNLPGDDLAQITTDSLDDCMDFCSVRNPLCYAVSYNIDTKICWMKNSVPSSTKAENGTHSAIASTAQLDGANTTCPYSNQEWVTTSSGLSFQISCGRDFSGKDYSPINWNFLHHTDTLEECMDLCAAAHPLCHAVAWNVDMLDGYANCYPKTSGDTSLLVTSPNTTHSAVASFGSVNSTCTDNSYYSQSDSSNATFAITCQQNIANSTIQSSHAQSIDDCIDVCGTYQNSTSTCAAVAFDDSMSDGYENCYLKSGTGPTTSGSNYSTAIISRDRRTAASTDSKSSNAGVIAGATVGAVVGVAAIAALVFFWFRKRQNKQAGFQQEADRGPEYTSVPENGSPTTDKPMLNELSDGRAIHELNTEERAHELSPGVYHELHAWDGDDDHNTQRLKATY